MEDKRKDPVRVLSGKYPRILVIKAMMKMLKNKEEVNVEKLEKVIIEIMRS